MPDPDKGDAPRQPSPSSLRSVGVQAQNPSLRSLLRLRQLAGEIQSALRRGDMDVVRLAADLLAPALSQWGEVHSQGESREESGNAETNQLARETQCALAECESLMQTAMAQLQAQSNQVRQHQQRLRRVRSLSAAPPAGRLLDTRR